MHHLNGYRKPAFAAFSLIELLSAMVIFTFVIGALSLALDASLGMVSSRSDSVEVRNDFNSIFDHFRRDVQMVIVDRPSSHSFGDTIPDQLGELVNKRSFIPIEINRTEGLGLPRSFINGSPRFSSLLFASVVSTASYAHPVRERLRMRAGGDAGTAIPVNQNPDAIGEVCLTGYYVAYTPNSAEPGAPYSMKLYRHFRPGGITFGEGHSNGILAFAADRFDPLSPRTSLNAESLSNRSLPFLMTRRYEFPNVWESEEITQPWPRYALSADLRVPPARTEPPVHNQDSWLEESHPIHNYVFADEEIARNVVEFECVPYKRIETAPGQIELFDATLLNTFLGMDNQEWPVLVKPDFLDITVSVVGVEAALQIEDESGWTMPPLNVPASDLSSIDRIKRKQLRRFSIRVPVN